MSSAAPTKNSIYNCVNEVNKIDCFTNKTVEKINKFDALPVVPLFAGVSLIRKGQFLFKKIHFYTKIISDLEKNQL